MLSCLVWGSPPPSLRWSELCNYDDQHELDDGHEHDEILKMLISKQAYIRRNFYRYRDTMVLDRNEDR